MPPLIVSVWPPASSLPPHDRWRSRANSSVQAVTTTWADFAAWLSAPLETADKHEQGFSPLPSIQPGKGGRVDGGDAQFLALEYDDSASEAAIVGALRVLARHDAVLYTTASATVPCPRFRAVVRTTRPMDAGAYGACVDHFGRLVGVTPAPESRQRTRLWYRPIRGAYVARVTGGPWDVDASVVACPPPPPRPPPVARTDDGLAHWPLDERVRQAWAALERRLPPGMFAASCICHDRGLPEDVAVMIVRAHADRRGWSYDPEDVGERVAHAYEYARDPFGYALIPTVLSHPELLRAR